MIMANASYTCRIDHDNQAVWRLLSAFTEIPWMMGMEEVTVGEHHGHVARFLHMPGIEPITEYLLNIDESNQSLQYSVVKNPFVPVDDYQATIAVSANEGGTLLSFDATYRLDGQSEEEISQMLQGFYQMMATSMDTYLQSHQ
jgi:hypothetical protein